MQGVGLWTVPELETDIGIGILRKLIWSPHTPPLPPLQCSVCRGGRFTTEMDKMKKAIKLTVNIS